MGLFGGLPRSDGTAGVNILVGVTGSVASVKLVPLVENLQRTFASEQHGQQERQQQQHSSRPRHVDIIVATTEHAKHFFDSAALPPTVPLLDDADEWATWGCMGDPVLHIELRKWADLFVIAPLDANSLAKLACGLCDNLVTCTARAWDVAKPLLVAPAMNTHMWDHPHTARQLSTLRDELGYHVIDATVKKLACGDFGKGAMEETPEIAKVAYGLWEQRKAARVAE